MYGRWKFIKCSLICVVVNDSNETIDRGTTAAGYIGMSRLGSVS